MIIIMYVNTVRFHLKENQLGAIFIFSIFLETSLLLSGISTAHHQEVHRMSVVLAMLEPSQENKTSSKKNNKYQLLYPHDVPPDDGL